jgi:hypothetical protein
MKVTINHNTKIIEITEAYEIAKPEEAGFNIKTIGKGQYKVHLIGNTTIGGPVFIANNPKGLWNKLVAVVEFIKWLFKRNKQIRHIMFFRSLSERFVSRYYHLKRWISRRAGDDD